MFDFFLVENVIILPVDVVRYALQTNRKMIDIS